MRCLPSTLLSLAEAQDGMFTRRQALDAGATRSEIDYRVGRVLMRPLPTVYAAFTGQLSSRQRLRAAVLYGRIGGDLDIGILGGLAACQVHGLRAAKGFYRVELLLPHRHRIASVGFVDIRRSTRPGDIWRTSGLPVCSPARAVVDAARRITELDAVRGLTAEAVQRGKCTVGALDEELSRGGSAGSRLTRHVLAEVSDGVRSAAEAWLRDLINSSAMPRPVWNADLFAPSGLWLATPDAIWPEAGLIAEVESREWHLSPESWAATMERTNRLSRLGYDVQQFPPSRIKRHPASVVADLRAAYAAGLLRARNLPPLKITIRDVNGECAK